MNDLVNEVSERVKNLSSISMNIIIIIIMFIVSNNINSYTYNQSADQLLNTFKTMEKKQIAYVSFFNYKLNILCATMSR